MNNGRTESIETIKGPRDKPLRVLVFGASGYIGTNLVPKLIAHGYQVRAAARSLKRLRAQPWPGVERVAADALKPETLATALADIDVAYYLVHSMGAGKHFKRIEQQTATNFAHAARDTGISRIIYLGGLLPEQVESEHLISRRMTGEILRASTVPVTEIRAGMIVGPGSAAFEVIRDLVNNLPVMITPKWVSSKSPPIALENLLYYLVKAPEMEEMADKLYDAGGPEMLSYRELMQQFGETVGKKIRVIPVPVLTPKLSSYWLRLVTTVPVSIASALIAGLKSDIPANSEPIRTLIPQPLLNFKASVRAVLEAEKNGQIISRWTEGALTCRDDNPAYAFYAKKASGSAIAKADLKSVWRVVTAIGGQQRYYGLNALWSLREIMDWFVGGPGRNYGRRHPEEVRVGDTIDSWRVIGVEPLKSLTLMMGMKAPGAGVLEFEIEPISTEQNHPETRVTATAYWHPAGTLGLLYWYMLVPIHLIIFKRMTKHIAQLAHQSEC